MVKRYFAIGDIHGCLHKLQQLLSTIKPTRHDELIFLGDYIDRGPDSKGVIEYLMRLGGIFKKKFLRGNHEDMFLRAIEDPPALGDVELWLRNGGNKTILSYQKKSIGMEKTSDMFPESHISFLKQTKLYYETDKYIFVHAGANPLVPMKEHKEDYLLWVRENFIIDETPWPKKVIFGHTPHEEPLVMSNKIGIDTGAVWDGKLTCLELPSEKFYQA